MTAQEDNQERFVYAQTIYKTDGSVLRGEIIEWTQEHMTMRLTSGLDVYVKLEDVSKIVSRRKAKAGVGTRGTTERSDQYQKPGLYNATSLALSAGPAAGIGMSHAVGHRFSQWLGLGGGLGAEVFDFNADRRFVSAFAEARGFLMDRNIAPYYAVRVGYGAAIRNRSSFTASDATGGLMWSAELGYRFGGWRPVNFFMGAGVRFQKATYDYSFFGSERIMDKLVYRRTELKFGVIF